MCNRSNCLTIAPPFRRRFEAFFLPWTRKSLEQLTYWNIVCDGGWVQYSNQLWLYDHVWTWGVIPLYIYTPLYMLLCLHEWLRNDGKKEWCLNQNISSYSRVSTRWLLHVWTNNSWSLGFNKNWKPPRTANEVHDVRNIVHAARYKDYPQVHFLPTLQDLRGGLTLLAITSWTSARNAAIHSGRTIGKVSEGDQMPVWLSAMLTLSLNFHCFPLWPIATCNHGFYLTRTS